MLFFRRGKSGAIFVPTIADKAAPTVSEITAGTAIGRAVATITGFETSLNRINQAVMAYSQELQVDGPQTFTDASMVLLEDDGTGSDADSVERTAAYTALVEGASGYIVLVPKTAAAPTSTTKVEVWPVKIGARNRSWSLDTETARYSVQFAISGAPNKAAVVAS